jgi:hypothetical protein
MEVVLTYFLSLLPKRNPCTPPPFHPGYRRVVASLTLQKDGQNTAKYNSKYSAPLPPPPFLSILTCIGFYFCFCCCSSASALLLILILFLLLLLLDRMFKSKGK